MSRKVQSAGQAGPFDVVPLIGRIAFTAVTQLLTYPLRKVRCSTLYNDILFGAIRCMLDRITIPQSRYLNPSTTARYISHCKKLNIQPQTLEVDTKDGKATAHWLGDSNADAILVYFHGGGYTQSANQGNFQYMTRLVNDLNREPKGRSIAVLILAYTLAPEAVHPTQLREATAVLAHLLHVRNYSPSSIIVGGDSAGGNLGFALLSHLLHPHPEVSPLKLEKPLGGALLYSPWTGFSTTYPSYKNENLDMLSPLALRKWSAMFLDKSNPSNPEMDPGPVSGDEWTEVCKNPSSWWEGLQDIVSDVFVSFGGDEVLADPIREVADKLKSGWSDGKGDEGHVIFMEAPGEAHIAPILESMTPGVRGKGNTQIAIEEWLKERLRD